MIFCKLAFRIGISVISWFFRVYFFGRVFYSYRLGVGFVYIYFRFLLEKSECL